MHIILVMIKRCCETDYAEINFIRPTLIFSHQYIKTRRISCDACKHCNNVVVTNIDCDFNFVSAVALIDVYVCLK